MKLALYSVNESECLRTARQAEFPLYHPVGTCGRISWLCCMSCNPCSSLLDTELLPNPRLRLWWLLSTGSKSFSRRPIPSSRNTQVGHDKNGSAFVNSPSQEPGVALSEQVVTYTKKLEFVDYCRVILSLYCASFHMQRSSSWPTTKLST